MAETDIQLKFPCPCNHDQIDLGWSHSSCHSPLYLCLDADLKCKSCPYRSFLANWSFRCNHSSPQGVWIKLTGYAELASAFGRMAASCAKEGKTCD